MEDEKQLFYAPLESMTNIGCEAVSNNGHKCNLTFQLKTFGLDKIDCKKYCIQHIYNWFVNLFITQLNYVITTEISPKSSSIKNSYNNSKSSILHNDINLQENIINLYCIIIKYNSNTNNSFLNLIVYKNYLIIKSKNNKILDKIYLEDYSTFFVELHNKYTITELQLIYINDNENLKINSSNISFYYNKNLINNIQIIKNHMFNELPNKYLFVKKLL